MLAVVASLLFAGCRGGQPFFGPKPSKVPEPIVRVRIVGPAYTIPVSVSGPFTLAGFDGKTLFQGSGLPYTPIKTDGDVLCLGNKRIPIADYCELIPGRNGALAVNSTNYRGWLRLYRTTDGQLIGVNHVKIEDYLKGVLPGEMLPKFGLETYKAQAIAARTFALYEKYTAPGSKKWDVLATEGSQMYPGLSAETEKSVRAVDATRGIVLTAELPGRGWKIFPTYYASACGGRTQAAVHLANISPAIQPLRGNVVCRDCRPSRYYTWTNSVFTGQGLADALNAKAAAPFTFKRVTALNILERAQNCRITRIQVVDVTGRQVILSGERFRLIVGSRNLPSTWCQLRRDGDNFVFYDGHGLGHGVGMCQYGAEGMTQRGYTALEVLKHYYPTAKPTRAY